MSKLYEVGIAGVAIQDALYDAMGEITPEIESALDNLLKDGVDALDGAAYVVRKLSADAEACKGEAKRLKERAEALERNTDALKNRMLFAVDAAFGGKLKTAKNTIWGQNAKAGLTIEVAPDADLIALDKTHSELVKKTYSLDTTAIRNRYEVGDAIPSEVVITERPATRFLRIL